MNKIQGYFIHNLHKIQGYFMLFVMFLSLYSNSEAFIASANFRIKEGIELQINTVKPGLH